MSPIPTYQIIAIQLSRAANSRGYKHIEYVYLLPKSSNIAPPRVLRRDLADQISAGTAAAIVSRNGHEISVGIEHVNGEKYLRTHRDGTVEDNLLHLPTYNADGQLLPPI